MANDPNPALRMELQAALDVIIPQVRGLKEFSKTSMSPDALTIVNEQIDARSHRSDLILASLHALDAVVSAREVLDADGYPNLHKTPVMGSIFAEIQEENSDLAIAVSVFEADHTAATMSVTLGVAAPKP